MSASHVCRVTVELDLRADDKADAYETLHAWADAVRGGDAAGIAVLQEFQVVRVRPSFRFEDIKELRKPPADPLDLSPTADPEWDASCQMASGALAHASNGLAKYLPHRETEVPPANCIP
jgi:hypothetical protein